MKITVKHSLPTFFQLCALLGAILFVNNVSAHDIEATETPQMVNDEQQPIEVSADRLDAAEKEGKSTYRGQVVITQGTTKITGDVITLNHPNSQLETAIATGKQATFKRFLPNEKKWINGRADQITYDAKARSILFKGNAYVEQEGNNSIEGPEIFYDIAQKTLSASGSKTENQRIKVIFTPEATPSESKTTEEKPQAPLVAPEATP